MNSFTLDTIKTLITQALLEQPTGDDWLDSRYNEQVHYIGHTNPYYKLFYLIAQTLRPSLSVELGSWQATAACHLAVGNPQGIIKTIDIHKDDKNAQARCIEAMEHYSNLYYLNAWTWDVVGTIRAIGQPVDLLFVDAWHNYDMAMREWQLYSPLLADNALVIADDITTAYNFEGMLRFWDELPGEKFLNSDVHPGIPMGFLRYVGPNREANQTQQPAATRRGRGRPKSRTA